jgi:hypothetical protein
MKDETTPTNGHPEDMELADPEIRRLLHLWKPPAVSPEFDERVLTSYRRQTETPLWRRLFTVSIPVPLPVAAVILILLLVSATLVLRNPDASAPHVPLLAKAKLTAQQLDDPPVVTRTSLAGFEPVTDMSVDIIPEIQMP